MRRASRLGNACRRTGARRGGARERRPQARCRRGHDRDGVGQPAPRRRREGRRRLRRRVGPRGRPRDARSRASTAPRASRAPAPPARSRASTAAAKQRVVTGLASFAAGRAGNTAIGPHGVFVDGHDVYFTNGGPTGPTRGDAARTIVLRDPTLVAEEPVSALYGKLFKLRRHGGLREIADLWRFENENNPDAEVGNPLVDSNPVDVYADRGRFYVADAAATASCGSGASAGSAPLARVPERPDPEPVRPRPDPDAGRADRRGQGPGRRALHEPADRLPVPGRGREACSASTRARAR